MKIKQHTVFIRQKQLLRNKLIYYYYLILKIPIILIKDFGRFTTKKTKYHGKNIFINIDYNAFLVQKC